ncbi:MAG: helix-turn-helix domain-containing protein [Stenotrophomonas sp.]|uniref:helix-turn-helix domain-containing protein n=1 Tax=Stenotrophomonas sp. TaxID=69392 RepID=UPI003D6CF8BA
MSVVELPISAVPPGIGEGLYAIAFSSGHVKFGRASQLSVRLTHYKRELIVSGGGRIIAAACDLSHAREKWLLDAAREELRSVQGELFFGDFQSAWSLIELALGTCFDAVGVVPRASVSAASFPKVLGAARERAGLTQRALSELVGVSHTQISRYEKGIGFPRPGMLNRLSNCLGSDLRHDHASAEAMTINLSSAVAEALLAESKLHGFLPELVAGRILERWCSQRNASKLAKA